ncbi:MAG: mandelate racemase/muconate lactonizing enzyme family protein [Chloroflexi bacterium]|nr:mandelate racemase/muconate lactonizing enzyme family protein [Chloroflexota bacterium]
MKITKAHIYLGQITGRRPILVQLFTDEGFTGVGHAAVDYGIGATAAAGMIKDLVEAVILGQDPFPIEALWNRMYDDSFWAKGGGPIVFSGMSAIEQALWDIKGKALGVPVYELLGGKYRDRVRVYANGWSFRSSTPDEFARAAEKVVADGYTALKLYPLATPDRSDSYGRIRHVSLRSIDREAERLAVARVRAVRDAVGWDVDVLVDVSAELTTDAIIRIGRQLEEFDLFFLEEPVDPFDVGALKKVSEHVNIPIAVGERLYTRYGFREVMERHAADILQPDVGNTGGLMETKKIAAMAEVYNMKIQPHHAGVTPVATAAALHLALCIPNLSIVELYPYRPAEHYAIVDHAPEHDREGSYLPAPTRPGLGVELVEARVAPFLWAVCENS